MTSESDSARTPQRLLALTHCMGNLRRSIGRRANLPRCCTAAPRLASFESALSVDTSNAASIVRGSQSCAHSSAG
jgi:hypothetical protein